MNAYDYRNEYYVDLYAKQNESIDGYHYDDGLYIEDRIWNYMQKEDLSLEEALASKGINFEDAVADEEDIPRLDKIRKHIEEGNLYPFEEYD